MDVELFNFELPRSHIAVRPASPRDSARMLVVHGAALTDAQVSALPQQLRAGDLLVFNDTKVIPARLMGKRGEAKIEITLHQRLEGSRWQAFAKPAKKCRIGDVLEFGELQADVIALGEDGERTVEFRVEPEFLMAALQKAGVMPLPPYIAAQRPVDARDADDYQTMFAEREGAVAAPTAGLHFTPELLARLKDAGVESAAVTLHVGAGTFLPVKAARTEDHKMHSEWGEISEATARAINEARARGGRVIAVGTTSLRILESAADDNGHILPFAGFTDIFITPGYAFRFVDILMTNFHLPKSTLFMLVSAFCGLEVMQAAYTHAVSEGYRFYSYGDASLLFRADTPDEKGYKNASTL